MLDPPHVRVLLSDDHPIVRRGVRTILESTSEYEICGEAGDGNQTLELALDLRPDVIITDISMRPTNGLEVTKQLHKSMPEAKVLILTMHDSVEMLRAAAVAGASGYLLKSAAPAMCGALLRRSPSPVEAGDSRSAAKPLIS